MRRLILLLFLLPGLAACAVETAATAAEVAALKAAEAENAKQTLARARADIAAAGSKAQERMGGQ